MTTSAQDLLDQPVTADRLELVLADSGVPPDAADRVRAIASRTPTAPEWRRFLASALLLFGAGLVLSGIVSFFAFNWAALGHLGKMGLIAGAMSACALGALPDPRRFVSRVLLMAASVLLGALLAVFGQAYQTGADPWGLFGAWALLILPWTLAARFTPLWLLWLVLVDTAYVLYVAQVLERRPREPILVLGLTAVHVLGVMAWEAQRLRTRPWLDDVWLPRVTFAAALCLLLAPTLTVVAWPSWPETIGPVALGTLSFLLVASGVYHRQVRLDPFMLTAVAGSIMAVFTTFMGRLLVVTLDLGVFGLMAMTGLIVAEVTLAVGWLRTLARESAS